MNELARLDFKLTYPNVTAHYATDLSPDEELPLLFLMAIKQCEDKNTTRFLVARALKLIGIRL